MTSGVLSAVDDALPATGLIVVPAGTPSLFDRPGRTVVTTAGLGDVADGEADGVVLVRDEFSTAGEHAEGLVAEVARALRVGGVLAATAANRLHAAATGTDLGGGRGYTAHELSRLVEHRGFTVDLLCAPGAWAGLRGAGHSKTNIDRDRQPGLLDAGPRLLVVARAPRDEEQRSERFFGSLPRKVVAAAVLCRDQSGRLLIVYDDFKRAWTIPGGVVDADEDPRAGAVRESYEEAGVHVQAGRILGVFSASWPDRVIFVYEATPVGGAVDRPRPVHTHEIGAARWAPLEEALGLFTPWTRYQVERCLAEPGGTWRQTVTGPAGGP